LGGEITDTRGKRAGSRTDGVQKRLKKDVEEVRSFEKRARRNSERWEEG